MEVQPSRRKPDASSKARGKSLGPRIALLLLILAGAGTLIYLSVRNDVPPGMGRFDSYALLAAAFGAIVGASELISRYRDEPGRALLSWAAGLYLLLNGVVSGLTYALLSRYRSALFPALADDPLMLSIVAGFGAMAILRSKFFTLRTAHGEDIAVGPDAAISAFLDAADRGVDRSRAGRRLDLVFKASTGIQEPKLGPQFLDISMAAMQNLNDEDKKRFVQRMEAVQETEYPDSLKLQAICYELLTLTGERNFEDIMSNLRSFVEAERRGGSEAGKS